MSTDKPLISSSSSAITPPTFEVDIDETFDEIVDEGANTDNFAAILPTLIADEVETVDETIDKTKDENTYNFAAIPPIPIINEVNTADETTDKTWYKNTDKSDFTAIPPMPIIEEVNTVDKTTGKIKEEDTSKSTFIATPPKPIIDEVKTIVETSVIEKTTTAPHKMKVVMKSKTRTGEKPFTVIVVQNRQFYQENSLNLKNETNLIQEIARMISSAEDSNILFIFPDVQRISDNSELRTFNDSVAHAFLLDDILRFVKDKGSRSVFGQQDVDDLKEQFGLCVSGDGFYYDIERDDLSKIKFIKAKE